jgi:hypothetical protein
MRLPRYPSLLETEDVTFCFQRPNPIAAASAHGRWKTICDGTHCFTLSGNTFGPWDKTDGPKNLDAALDHLTSPNIIMSLFKKDDRSD